MSAEEVQIAEEIQIDTKLFKSWRKKFVGKSNYQYIGPTYTNSFAEEKRWTPIEVAKQWGVSTLSAPYSATNPEC
jgi:hypothetical protein